ncbi:MAG: SprT family zinc-dependent metalloprotease [Planctomycetaceae bacterium]|nr:SprT family zinc-dependent metalloprotease [Planctomycetaceae bacterium]
MIYQRVKKHQPFCVEWSPRLKRNLAVTYPKRNIIRVSTDLALPENQHLLPEVLTHEIAHLEAYRLVQSTERPHGATWQKIVRSEGFEPRTSLMLAKSLQSPHPNSQEVHLHTCPTCTQTRIAKKPMKTWRCEDCLKAGLDGRLQIKRKS